MYLDIAVVDKEARVCCACQLEVAVIDIKACLSACPYR